MSRELYRALAEEIERCGGTAVLPQGIPLTVAWPWIQPGQYRMGPPLWKIVDVCGDRVFCETPSGKGTLAADRATVEGWPVIDGFPIESMLAEALQEGRALALKVIGCTPRRWFTHGQLVPDEAMIDVDGEQRPLAPYLEAPPHDPLPEMGTTFSTGMRWDGPTCDPWKDLQRVRTDGSVGWRPPTKADADELRAIMDAFIREHETFVSSSAYLPLDFQDVYVARFPADLKWDRAFWIWASCEVACESFDRTVCTGPMMNGGILPATREQHAAINQHAYDRRREADQLLRVAGIDVETSQSAHRALQRRSHEELLEIVRRGDPAKPVSR